MPELPEVETIRRGLSRRILGRRVREVRVTEPRILRFHPSARLHALSGQRIEELQRRGKFLVFELEQHCCVFHLGMTGQLTFRDPQREDASGFERHPVTGLQRAPQHPPDRHTHLHLLFEDGTAVLYRDVRKFGKIYLLEKAKDSLADFFGGLGLEPFTPDYNLRDFLSRLGKRKLRLKSLLLDQGFVAGVGNIYADEALFESGLHPARLVKSLRRSEKARLFEAIPRVLERGIASGGTTFRDYVDSEGQEGAHQERLNVYGRRGEPCVRCGFPIQRLVIGQRSAHFCPRCQPRRP